MSQTTIKIFVSKKEEHRDIAREIQEQLELYGGDRLVFYDSTNIPAGKEWLPWIRDSLRQADLVLLLLAGPSTDWDWPLYEIGLFTPVSPGEEKPIVCWHHPKMAPPEPLQHVQAVKAEVRSMIPHLRKLFGTSEITMKEPPISKRVAENEQVLRKLAEIFCKLFEPEPPRRKVYYNRRLKLIVDPSRVTKEMIPGDALVKADSATLEIFDFVGPQGEDLVWRNIEDKVRSQGKDFEWIDELANAVDRACKGWGLRPFTSMIQSLTEDKVYLPNLSSREDLDKGAMELEILLIHQPKPRFTIRPVETTVQE